MERPLRGGWARRGRSVSTESALFAEVDVLPELRVVLANHQPVGIVPAVLARYIGEPGARGAAELDDGAEVVALGHTVLSRTTWRVTLARQNTNGVAAIPAVRAPCAGYRFHKTGGSMLPVTLLTGLDAAFRDAVAG